MMIAPELEPFVLRRMVALRQFPMFAAAELGELAALAENLGETRFAKGELIAPAGARLPALHLVLEGAITTRRGASWGPRDVFGTLEVLARRPLAAPAFAASATRTLKLHASDITEVLEENFAVLLATLRELATRMAAHGALRQRTLAIPAVEPLGFVERLIVLRQQTPFAAAGLDALAALAHASDEVEFAPGAIVARAGDPAATAYVVVAGELRAGDRALRPGDAIACLEALAELRHQTTLEAATRVRALATPAPAMLDVIEDHTDLGLAMVRSFAGELLDATARES